MASLLSWSQFCELFCMNSTLFHYNLTSYSSLDHGVMAHGHGRAIIIIIMDIVVEAFLDTYLLVWLVFGLVTTLIVKIGEDIIKSVWRDSIRIKRNGTKNGIMRNGGLVERDKVSILNRRYRYQFANINIGTEQPQLEQPQDDNSMKSLPDQSSSDHGTNYGLWKS